MTQASGHQPGGLTDSSRWLKRSENHRKKSEKSCTQEGCENLKGLSHLAPRRGAVFLPASTGGLRFAATTGYFLATLWVATLHFQIEFANCRIENVFFFLPTAPASCSLFFAPREAISYTSALPIALRWPFRQWPYQRPDSQLY